MTGLLLLGPRRLRRAGLGCARLRARSSAGAGLAARFSGHFVVRHRAPPLRLPPTGSSHRLIDRGPGRGTHVLRRYAAYRAALASRLPIAAGIALPTNFSIVASSPEYRPLPMIRTRSPIVSPPRPAPAVRSIATTLVRV